MSGETSNTFIKFGKLPELVKFFLTSNKTIDKRIEIAAKYGVVESGSLIISRILNEIYFGEAGFAELPQMLETELKIPPEAAKQMALDYAGFELLPISSLVGDVDSFIRSLGGNPADYPGERIVLKEETPSELITEFLHEHPTNVPAHLEHRLREILESRVRSVRKDDETVTRLTRAEKIGGVELPREEAEKLVEALAAKIASVKIAPDVEPAPAVSAPTAIPIEAKPRQADDSSIVPTTYNLQATSSTKSGHGFTPDDEREANVIREKVLPNVVPPEVFDLEKEIRSATEAVADATTVALSVMMLERYKAIVASRFKGVRDSAETRELIMREAAKGGMGFSPSDVAASVNIIEKQALILNGKREEALKNEKNDFVKRSVDETFAKDESRKKGELEELDRMYGSLTGKVGKLPTQSVGNDQQLTTKFQGNIQEPIINNQVTKSLPPTPAPVSTPTVPQPVFHATITPPRPLSPNAPPVLTTRNSELGTRMQDVRRASPAVAAKLTGPVQELANLTLADFRRLGADPVEACRKLSDKLDILEEHSYGARIAGIRAWQGSEVNNLYLQTINAAFSGGKPIAAAIAEAMGAGRETLTEREVRAIMELNRQLKA